jgi:hypothetical protein
VIHLRVLNVTSSNRTLNPSFIILVIHPSLSSLQSKIHFASPRSLALPFPRRRRSRRAAPPPHVIVARAVPPPRSRRHACVVPLPPSCRRASTLLAPLRRPCLHLARPAAPPVPGYATSPSASLAPLLCLTSLLLTLRLHLARDVAPAPCLRLPRHRCLRRTVPPPPSRRRASTSLAPLRPCHGSATLGPSRIHLGRVATPALRLRLPRAAMPPPRSHRLRAPPRRTGRRRL